MGWYDDWLVHLENPAKILDAVVSDRPVGLRRFDGHAVWVIRQSHH
jgi:hypothetical protein